MKNALYIAAALLGGALLAIMLLDAPGYVALRVAGCLIVMSAVTFVLLAVVAYFVARLALRALSARRLWKASQLQRRRERARRSLALGLLELARGEWETAETTLTRHVHDAEHPLAHYLAAARAAELQGAARRRDELLARAQEITTESRAPALIMQAEIHMKHKQLEAALTTLEQLEASGEQNARGLLLLASVYRQTGDWQRLQEIEPRLRSTRGISAGVADDIVAQMHLDRLKAAGAKRDAAALQTAWKSMPKSLAKRSHVVVAYANAAMACGDHDAAEVELREGIGRQWNEAAVLAYGELESGDPFKLLERAEAWLPQRPEDSALLLTCAELAARAELYGKARSYLETSIAIKPRLEAYQLLASLMEQLGDRERALQALQDALTFAVGRRTRLKVQPRRWLERRRGERRS
jgi:HemY protein